MITNITDALVPFFSGNNNKRWDEAVEDAYKLFLKTFEDETFFRKLQ